MNSQSGTDIPPEAIDRLRSHQNLVVTAGHGSAAQRQALEEIFTSTWEMSNEFLVVCSDAVFVQVTEILHELMVLTWITTCHGWFLSRPSICLWNGSGSLIPS